MPRKSICLLVLNRRVSFSVIFFDQMELITFILNGRYSLLRIEYHVVSSVPEFQTKPADPRPVRLVLLCKFKNGGGVAAFLCSSCFYTYFLSNQLVPVCLPSCLFLPSKSLPKITSKG
jgi:hypothetical protein